MKVEEATTVDGKQIKFRREGSAVEYQEAPFTGYWTLTGTAAWWLTRSASELRAIADLLDNA